jgi:aspartokinase
MPSNGHLNALAERIRAKTEQDAQEIENLTRQQFESLSRSLAASSKNALSTTENAIHSSIAELEKNVTSRCRSLGEMFNRKYLYAILLSAGILALTFFTAWGLITLYRYQIEDLRQEIAGLKDEKAAWDRDFPPIHRAFSGLELYQSEGKKYLLLPEGRTSRMAGTVDKREAWEIVRK